VVAMDLDENKPAKRVKFEELVAEDDIDVPDFMK
jgi:cell division protein FtsZ